MPVNSVVTRAIALELDVVEAWPGIMDLPVENLTLSVDGFIDDLQDDLTKAIEERIPYLLTGDAAGVCEMLLGRVRLSLPICCRLRIHEDLWVVFVQPPS